MISNNVPNHLIVGVRTGFLAALPNIKMNYQRIAATVPMKTAEMTLTDIGAAPMPVESKGRLQAQDFIEKSKGLHARGWESTVHISQDAVDDDQTGDLYRKVQSAGDNFQRWLNNRCFKALNDGDSTSSVFGLCYDGAAMFSASHIDDGAQYQTAQDNVSALALSIDNFETVKVASKKFVDDQGEEIDYDYNLLIVSPELERIAAQICKNADAYDTGNREMNPYAGVTQYIVSPKFDSTAWILAAENASAKPIIIGERKAPQLQHAWFDPNGPDGGMYYFKFYARYDVVYGDWRLAHMGNT
jgi:phage major head subunit gpT-like protein